MSSPYTSPLAAEVGPDVLDRFLRYVRIDTQAEEGVAAFPSTQKQLDLSRLLLRELEEMGAAEAALDEHGYVTATLKATDGDGAPTVGLLAHVDTSPEAAGAGVEPRVLRGYDGGAIRYPADPSLVLTPEDSPALRECVGKDIVTSDGTTLLGADDKAGVAAIMAAARYLLEHPEVPHGRVRIAFTVDEEVGRGVDLFDIQGFGADIAYTIDGADRGSIEDETFSARQAVVSFIGNNTHPGYAKDKLLNSIRMAAAFVERLPRDLAPETTAGRDGFVHPWSIAGGCDKTVVKVLARDFDDDVLEGHVQLIRRAAEDAAATVSGGRVDVEVVEQYRNMRSYLEGDGRPVQIAERAIRAAGLEPRRGAIRGGTDGARLTERGLPTPNLFAGMHEIHSTREWVCVQDMADAVATIVHLVRLWGEESSA